MNKRLEKQIIDIIEQNTNQEINSLDDKLQFDSLDAIEILMNIEEKFDIYGEIDDDDFCKCRTIKDILNIVQQTISKQLANN